MKILEVWIGVEFLQRGFAFIFVGRREQGMAGGRGALPT